MTIEDDIRVCAVCGRTLEQLRSRSTGKLFYRHSAIDAQADHPPVAVAPTDAGAQRQPRCDFCAGEPVTHSLIADRELRVELVDTDYGTEWSMCPVCAALVMTNDWLNLRRRVFEGYEAKYGDLSEQVKIEIRVMHAELRKAVVMVYQHEQAE